MHFCVQVNGLILESRFEKGWCTRPGARQAFAFLRDGSERAHPAAVQGWVHGREVEGEDGHHQLRAELAVAAGECRTLCKTPLSIECLLNHPSEAFLASEPPVSRQQSSCRALSPRFEGFKGFLSQDMALPCSEVWGLGHTSPTETRPRPAPGHELCPCPLLATSCTGTACGKPSCHRWAQTPSAVVFLRADRCFPCCTTNPLIAKQNINTAVI